MNRPPLDARPGRRDWADWLLVECALALALLSAFRQYEFRQCLFGCTGWTTVGGADVWRTGGTVLVAATCLFVPWRPVRLVSAGLAFGWGVFAHEIVDFDARAALAEFHPFIAWQVGGWVNVIGFLACVGRTGEAAVRRASGRPRNASPTETLPHNAVHPRA